MGKMSLQAMIEAAIFAALALILDLLPSIKLNPSISISFAMVPIFIVAFRWGIKTGILSGFLWGILQIAVGDFYIIHPLQGILEYPIAFGVIGVAGIVAHHIQKLTLENQRGKMFLWIFIGIFIGSFIRYFCHFLSGVIYFGSYAKEAGQTPIMYSLIMNGTTMVGAIILCAIILSTLLMVRPQLLTFRKPNLILTDKKAS